MLDYYTPTQIGRTQSLTPEGFLLCRDVPISRVGTLTYGEHELIGLVGERGIIYVERLPEDVFSPNAIASFAGKPVIVTHAGGTVTPETWREYAVGTILNPRQGEDDEANLLLADLLIYDPDMIDKVRARVGHQVSGGYSAEYEQLSPGRARQYEIIGNHVAFVESGRCGPRCSVGDEAMPIGRRPMPTTPRRRTTLDAAFKARILRAFRTGDEDALTNALNTAGPDEVGEDQNPMMEDDGGPDTSSASPASIVVNINGSGASVAPDPAAMGAAPTVPGAPVMPGAAAPTPPAGGDMMPPWMAPIVQRISAIEAAVQGMAPKPAAPAATPAATPPASDPTKTQDESLGDLGETMVEATPDDGGLNTKLPGDPPTLEKVDLAGVQNGLTMDSEPTKTLFQATMANAEILAPGVKMLTMDARQTVQQTQDSLCAFRRVVLSRATADAAMSQRIGPLVDGKDFKRMPCAEVKMTFDASATLVKAMNANRVLTGFMPRPQSGGGSKVMSAAEINVQNRKLYGYDA